MCRGQNANCHCVHVDALIAEVDDLKAVVAHQAERLDLVPDARPTVLPTLPQGPLTAVVGETYRQAQQPSGERQEHGHDALPQPLLNHHGMYQAPGHGTNIPVTTHNISAPYWSGQGSFNTGQQPSYSQQQQDWHQSAPSFGGQDPYADHRAFLPGQQAPEQVPSLPLNLGSLGSIDAQKIFDLKMAPDKYEFDGIKGGDTWKMSISDYSKGCVPAMREILRWAERILENFILTKPLLDAAVGTTLSHHQQDSLNSALWGP